MADRRNNCLFRSVGRAGCARGHLASLEQGCQRRPLVPVIARDAWPRLAAADFPFAIAAQHGHESSQRLAAIKLFDVGSGKSAWPCGEDHNGLGRRNCAVTIKKVGGTAAVLACKASS